MIIYTKITEVQAFLSEARQKGRSIGFVPTMGALHKGHISLIEASGKSCDLTICSIFVNPTQFNDKADLERYPRTPGADAKMLANTACDLLFLPSVEEIYPAATSEESFEFGVLDKVLEASHRPGHFNGVAQVVKRFFEIIHPDKAFFGSKDFQQVLIIKSLVKQLGFPIEIEVCPILREVDGLAMSSRNALLSAGERLLAGQIPELMRKAAEIAKNQGIVASKHFVLNALRPHSEMKLDYFEICRTDTLESIQEKQSLQGAVALIALYVGKIRLIDNLIL